MHTGLPTPITNTGADAPTVACQICRDNVPLGDTVALRACGHQFCAACISQYLNVRIREGDVEPTCFHQDDTTAHSTCGKLLADEDIQTLVAPVTYSMFTHFRTIKSNPQARHCPFCDHVQVHSATAKHPACVCECCGQGFCFTHGNAHTNKESCSQYEKRQSRDDKRSRRVVSEISRPCPGCTRPIEKDGGCSHMICSVCHTQFCGYCGMKWGFDRSNHIDALHLESCDGMAETHVYPMDSTSTSVRAIGKGVYYLTLTVLGWPLTIALCWAWIPYTLWAENRAVARRARVLARFIAILVSLVIMMNVELVVASVDFAFEMLGYTLEWLAEMSLQGLRKLRRLVCSCSCRCRGKTRASEKTEVDSGYDAYEDVVVFL